MGLKNKLFLALLSALVFGCSSTATSPVAQQETIDESQPMVVSEESAEPSDFDADGIIGSRFNYSDYTRSHNILNKFANNIITLTFNLLYNTTFTDIYSCYFAYKKGLLDASQLKTSGFEQHAEIGCRVIKNGKKFYEVPINYNGRSYLEGKKIKPQHFFFVLYQILLRRFF